MKRFSLIRAAIVAFILLFMMMVIAFMFTGKGNSESISARAISSSEAGEIYNVLLLGKDDAAGLCDSIMLVSINTKSNDMNLLQIPRDTYFNISDSSYKKINGALRALGSAEKFAKSLEDALGIKIHYYLSIGTEAVKKIIDAVGGVELNIPYDMDYDDPYQGLSIHLSSGVHHLSGEEALGFLRYRSGYVSGDIGRLDAQKLFLNALVDKLAKMKDVTAYFTLFKTVRSLCETNIKEQDIITIGLKCSNNKDGKAYYVTAPGEAVQSEDSGAWYYILSREATAELLASRFAPTNDKKDFDSANKFVDKRVKSFYDIYNKRCPYTIYTADDIKNNDIRIN